VPKLDRNVTKEYFELDFGGQRFTHYPSGDTCLRHEWMIGYRDGPKWTSKLTDFFAAHPEASVIVSSKYEVIDDANSLPHRGGEYKVGDVVLMRVHEGNENWEWCARTITERLDFPGDAVTEPLTTFKLDDGSGIYWHDHNNGWLTFRMDAPLERSLRVRRPVDGEEILTLEERKEAAKAFRP
jgi:hypothetical protein